VREIDQSDVLRVLAPIWTEKAETARRVRQRVRTVMDWARTAGHFEGVNPVEGVEKGLAKQKDRVTHHAAMPWGDVPGFLHELGESIAALTGERDEAWQLLEDAVEACSGAYRSPLAPGLVHAACSEMDAAFECVQRAIDERDPLLMYLQVHPMFDALRADPRYPELLRRMNLPEGGRPGN